MHYYNQIPNPNIKWGKIVYTSQNPKQYSRIVHMSTPHIHRSSTLDKFRSRVTYTTKNLLCLQASRLTQICAPCYLEFAKDVTSLYTHTWRSVWYHFQLIEVIMNSSSWSDKSGLLEHLAAKQNGHKNLTIPRGNFLMKLHSGRLVSYLILSPFCEEWWSAFRSVAPQFWAGSKSTWSMYRFDFVLFSRQASKNVVSWDIKGFHLLTIW